MSVERSRVTAALAALLLAGVGASPAMADDCVRLVETDNVYAAPVPAASRKPQNLTVGDNSIYGEALGGWELTWTIASDFPQGVLTGNCVEYSHPDSERTKEYCNDGTTSAPATRCWGSVYDRNFDCPSGTHRYKVKFQTNCGVTMPWSDTADRDR